MAEVILAALNGTRRPSRLWIRLKTVPMASPAVSTDGSPTPARPRTPSSNSPSKSACVRILLFHSRVSRATTQPDKKGPSRRPPAVRGGIIGIGLLNRRTTPFKPRSRPALSRPSAVSLTTVCWVVKRCQHKMLLFRAISACAWNDGIFQPPSTSATTDRLAPDPATPDPWIQ